MQKDIRWKQRFASFEKAFFRLREAIEKPNLNELERNGLVQRFEFTLELCWKTLKDYLVSQGLEFTPTPKETFRQAFNSEIIVTSQILMDALEVRNQLSHDYDGAKFEASEAALRDSIYPELENVYKTLLEL